MSRYSLSYITIDFIQSQSCGKQKPHPIRRPPLCRRGAGGEAMPRERENQINTLVLKDINFTINIIELSYYRTIDILNQSKNAPVVLPPQAPPKEGMSPSLLTYFRSFQTIPNKDIPSFGGAWVGFFFGGRTFTLPLVHSLLYSPFLSVRGRG